MKIYDTVWTVWLKAVFRKVLTWGGVQKSLPETRTNYTVYTVSWKNRLCARGPYRPGRRPPCRRAATCGYVGTHGVCQAHQLPARDTRALPPCCTADTPRRAHDGHGPRRTHCYVGGIAPTGTERVWVLDPCRIRRQNRLGGYPFAGARFSNWGLASLKWGLAALKWGRRCAKNEICP